MAIMSSIPSSILSGPPAGGAKHPPPEGSGVGVAVRVGVAEGVSVPVGVLVRVGVREVVGNGVGVFVGTNITIGVGVALSSVDSKPLGVAVA